MLHFLNHDEDLIEQAPVAGRYLIQFSSGRSSTLENSRSLSLTRVYPEVRVCAAMSRSLAPIDWPAFSRWLRSLP